MNLDQLAEALAVHGLSLRGGFEFGTDDDAPPGPSGRRARSIVLVGNTGEAFWPHFSRWRAALPIDLADPLDSWSREVIGAVAATFSARAVFPFDKPYLPFQRWAMRAEGLRPSPLGILIHPQFGLWHAYRGALLFDEAITLDPVRASNHPCDACIGKPCLSACPAGAVKEERYDHDACRSHVRSASGASCRTKGCLARQACPVGAAWRYGEEQQAFHMAAFVR